MQCAAPSSCSAAWSRATQASRWIGISCSAWGVNLGDVIVEQDDIYGDGVNVAARLEALAEPGGLFISGTVFNHIREKVPYAFDDKGGQIVKNISQPVRVYAFGADAVAALPESPASTGTTRLVGVASDRVAAEDGRSES